MRINSIDYIRFFLICLIVLNHLNYNIELFPEIYSSTLLYNEIPTPTLGLISGILFFKPNIHKKIIIQKLKRRWSSLLLPFIIWSFILLFFYNLSHLILSTTNYSNDIVTLNELSNFKLINYLVILISPQNSLWYLQNLSFVLPFTFLIYYLLKNKLFIVTFLIVVILYSNDIDLFFSERFLPFFLFGSFLGYKNIKVLELSTNKYFLIIPIIIVFLLNNIYDYNSFFKIIIHVLNVYIFYVLVFNFFSKINSKFLLWISNYSFFIYLTHVIISSVITKTYNLFFGDYLLSSKISFITINLFFFILIILISIMLARFVELNFRKTYSILVGKRIQNI